MSRGLRLARFSSISLAAALLIAAAAPAAGAEHVVRSCYAMSGIGFAPSPPNRAIFVLVDQTTPFDGGLRRLLEENVRRLVRPGTTFVIASFSAVGPGHYPRVIVSGTLEPPLTDQQRVHGAATPVRTLDRCLARQGPYGVHRAVQGLRHALNVRHSSFRNSEIMKSLQQFAIRVAGSRTRDRIVIVASDMLEHSTATSFYRNQALRQIEWQAELANAARLRLMGDFRGARLFVIGAGLLPPQPGERPPPRDIRAVNALEAFWRAWFHRSRARLIVFGVPSLPEPIR